MLATLNIALPLGPTLGDNKGIDYEALKDLLINDLNEHYHYESQERVVDDMRFSISALEWVLEKAYVVSPAGSENYAVKFKAGQESLDDLIMPTKELNVFILGTEATLHFGGKHKDVYEGGDVLCRLGLHKGIEQAQPTFLLRGVGTANFDSATDYYNISKKQNESTAGSDSESLLGLGASLRLRIAMEQFFIPTLLKMIDKKSKQNQTLYENADYFTFNLIGHSRGAICCYAMANCIDKWINEIKILNAIELEKMISEISDAFDRATQYKTQGQKGNERPLSKEEIANAFKIIRENKMHFQTKLMLYDPVEGEMAFGDWDTTCLTLSLFGKEVTCDYSSIPETVAETQIFLACDERRKAFEPTLSTRVNPIQSKMVIIPTIGVHGTLKGYFSVFDDKGQDSYLAEKDSLFLKEALRALVDWIKVKSTKFLFKQLPPFDKNTLYHIFYANHLEGYTITKNHLFTKIASLQEIPTTHEALIACCEQIMKADPHLCHTLYATLEEDIDKIYLFSKEEIKQNLLNKLRQEMRTDVMHIAGPFDLTNQDSNESRSIWIRNSEGAKLQKISLSALYNQYLSEKLESCIKLVDDYGCSELAQNPKGENKAERRRHEEKNIEIMSKVNVPLIELYELKRKITTQSTNESDILDQMHALQAVKDKLRALTINGKEGEKGLKYFS